MFPLATCRRGRPERFRWPSSRSPQLAHTSGSGVDFFFFSAFFVEYHICNNEYKQHDDATRRCNTFLVENCNFSTDFQVVFCRRYFSEGLSVPSRRPVPSHAFSVVSVTASNKQDPVLVLNDYQTCAIRPARSHVPL